MRRTPRRVRPARSTAAMVVGDGLLLALALTGLFLFQFNVYGLPGSRDVVLGCCLGAALLALIVFSLPKYRWAAALVALAAGLMLLWNHWEAVSRGAQAVYAAIARAVTDATGFPGYAAVPDWLEEALPDAARSVPPDWWLEEALVPPVNAFLAAVIFGLSLPLGWAVVRRRAFLPVFALTLPWLIPIFLAEFPPDLPSLSLLCACWMALALTGLTARHDPAGGARLTLAALPGALAALLCVCLLFPQEGYVYPLWAATAAQRLTEFGEGIENPFLPQQTAAAPPSVDLANSGPRHYQGERLYRVESSWSGRLYLRGTAYAVYAGGRWLQLEDGALAELEALGGSTIFAAEGGGADVKTVTVSSLKGASYLAYCPYAMLDLSAGAEYLADSWLCFDEPQESYTARFYSREFSHGANGGQEYRQFVYDHYLDVPGELKDALEFWWTTWAAVSDAPGSGLYDGGGAAGNQTSPAKAVKQIAGLLEKTARYDLNTPVTPEGEDFVKYFLRESRQGYCVHFASAAVLLLRQVGVPARYVSGYTVDVVDGVGYVTDSCAHAWVEIYQDGVGWTPLEVTPAAAFYQRPSAAPEESEAVEPSQPTASRPPLPSEAPSAAPSAAPPAAPSQAPSGAPGPEGPGGEEGTPLDLSWLRYAAVAAVAAGLTALYRALRKRRRDRLGTLPDVNRAVLDAYRWYQKLALWGGGGDHQMEALARKAKFSQHTLTEDERAEALDVLRRETARVEQALPAWKRWLFRYLYVWK